MLLVFLFAYFYFLFFGEMPWKLLNSNGDFTVNLHSHHFVNSFLLMELILSGQMNVTLTKGIVLCGHMLTPPVPTPTPNSAPSLELDTGLGNRPHLKVED